MNMDLTEIKHKKELIEIHTVIMVDLLTRIAKMGEIVPPHFKLDLEERMQEVIKLCMEINVPLPYVVKESQRVLNISDDKIREAVLSERWNRAYIDGNNNIIIQDVEGSKITINQSDTEELVAIKELVERILSEIKK